MAALQHHHGADGRHCNNVSSGGVTEPTWLDFTELTVFAAHSLLKVNTNIRTELKQ